MRPRAAPPPELAALAAGACATVLAALWVVRVPGDVATMTLVGPVIFATLVVGFALRPHLTFAGMIPFFVFTPVLKLFVDPRIGALKDVVVVAAGLAAAAVFVYRRRLRQDAVADDTAFVLAMFLALLYVLNVGGNFTGGDAYGQGWIHGTRLRLEPLLLFVAALVLPDPRRTLRYVAISMVGTGCVVAAYGVFQQILGEARLAELGYTYGEELRTVEGQLRSFGTLDSPFTYAAFIVLALSVALFWPLRRSVRVASLSILAAGLAASLVRTTAVLTVAFAALWLVRRGSRTGAALLAAAAVVAGLAVFSSLDSRTTRTVQASPTLYLTLNGRTTVWEERLGGRSEAWLLGEGVGTSGTAATRAEQALFGEKDEPDTEEELVVDSGYFVTILDVGLVGLALTLLLLGRLAMVSRRAASRGDPVGWIGLATVTAMLFTALTAEAFSDFPYAYLAMLILGLTCAAVATDAGEGEVETTAARPRGAA